MKAYSLIIFFAGISFSLFSQTLITDFTMMLPEQKVPHSRYHKIAFIDSRYDTANMGTVLTGTMNRVTKVVTKTPLPVQLSNTLDALTDGTAQDGELLFQLRELNFAEQTLTVNEKGYYKIRASLYVKAQNKYIKTGFIDTVAEIRALDVTKPLFKEASECIAGFIASHLMQQPVDTVAYNYDEVAHIDSIEKSSIPVYTASQYADGYYTSYQSFKNMIPDGVIAADIKNGKITSVKTTGKKGQLTKILYNQDVYAIVYNGQPYISTDYGYYPLQKTNNDFVFMGKALVSAKSTGIQVANVVLFGFVGAIFNENKEAVYRMKIDHLHGDFVWLEKIKVGKQVSPPETLL